MKYADMSPDQKKKIAQIFLKFLKHGGVGEQEQAGFSRVYESCRNSTRESPRGWVNTFYLWEDLAIGYAGGHNLHEQWRYLCDEVGLE